MAEAKSVIAYQRTLFEPEHEMFRESFRTFLERHVAPHHDQWEKDKLVDRGVWQEAGKQGFLSLIHISEPTRLIIRSRMPSSA